MASQDVEAGRAYVTLYLRRVGFDKQVQQAAADTKKMEGQGDGPQRPYTEAGISMPAELASSVAKGASGWLGGTLAANLARVIPLLRSLPTIAAGATAGVSALGMASSGAGTAVAAQAVATQHAAIVTAELVPAAAAAAPAVAATGVAAAGSATGFAALATAALPIIAPLAALAVAATAIYVAIFKWEKLPIVVKLLLAPMWPLVAVVKAAKLAFSALSMAVSAITAPFRLAAATVGLFYRAVVAIPGAIAAIPGLMLRVGAAAWDMGKKIAAAAGQMAATVGKAVVATGAALARLPSQLAGYAAGAVDAVSGAIQSLGMTIGKAGAVAAGLSAAIVGPLTVAAKQFGDYGDKIRQVQTEYQRFALTAEETSVIIRVSEQTGESIQKLAEQMREGTRDFSRWRNEVRASGMEMSGGGLGAALALSRAYYALQESLSGLRMALGEAVAPALTESTRVLIGSVRAVTKWVAENRPLIAQVFRVASIVGIAAGAVTTLGGAIAGAGALLSPFTAALAAIAAGLAVVEVRTGAGRSIWTAYGDAVRRVYQTVTGYLGQMAAFAGKVIGGVKDALVAGDLAAAVNVAWAGAKVAWMTGLLEIDRLTSGMFGGILRNLAAGHWAAAGEAAMLALQVAFQQAAITLSGVWGQVVDAADLAWMGLQVGFDLAIGGIEKAWLGVWESMKRASLQAFKWIYDSALRPLVDFLRENDPTGYFALQATKGLNALTRGVNEAAKSQRSPAQLAADQSAIDAQTSASQQAREDALISRRGERETAADRARIARETEIARLRQRQAELARQGSNATQGQQSANQRALDQAIAAAKVARDAADAARPNAEDFAVSTKTASTTRFSAAAIELAVGRGANDPQKRIAKFSEEQVRVLREMANTADMTYREMAAFVRAGGFA